jgi:hypothetical protein
MQAVPGSVGAVVRATRSTKSDSRSSRARSRAEAVGARVRIRSASTGAGGPLTRRTGRCVRAGGDGRAGKRERVAMRNRSFRAGELNLFPPLSPSPHLNQRPSRGHQPPSTPPSTPTSGIAEVAAILPSWIRSRRPHSARTSRKSSPRPVSNPLTAPKVSLRATATLQVHQSPLSCAHSAASVFPCHNPPQTRPSVPRNPSRRPQTSSAGKGLGRPHAASPKPPRVAAPPAGPPAVVAPGAGAHLIAPLVSAPHPLGLSVVLAAPSPPGRPPPPPTLRWLPYSSPSSKPSSPHRIKFSISMSITLTRSSRICLRIASSSSAPVSTSPHLFSADSTASSSCFLLLFSHRRPASSTTSHPEPAAAAAAAAAAGGNAAVLPPCSSSRGRSSTTRAAPAASSAASPASSWRGTRHRASSSSSSFVLVRCTSSSGASLQPVGVCTTRGDKRSALDLSTSQLSSAARIAIVRRRVAPPSPRRPHLRPQLHASVAQ